MSIEKVSSYLALGVVKFLSMVCHPDVQPFFHLAHVLLIAGSTGYDVHQKFRSTGESGGDGVRHSRGRGRDGYSLRENWTCEAFGTAAFRGRAKNSIRAEGGGRGWFVKSNVSSKRRSSHEFFNVR